MDIQCCEKAAMSHASETPTAAAESLRAGSVEDRRLVRFKVTSMLTGIYQG